MKSTKDLLREVGSDRDSHATIARRAWMQKQIQQSCAIGLARWLMSVGEPVAAFSWTYERE